MIIFAFTICFITSPLTFINIPITMNYSSPTFCFTIYPIPFKNRSIRPYTSPYPISLPIFPLSFINSSIMNQFIILFIIVDYIIHITIFEIPQLLHLLNHLFSQTLHPINFAYYCILF